MVTHYLGAGRCVNLGRMLLFAFAVCTLAVAGCGRRAGGTPAGAGSGTPGGKPITVVCTTGMVADAARVIGGDRVRVTQLLGAGVDPHLYRPSPSDMRAMREADVVLSSGLHLEGRMGEVLANPGKGVLARAIAERIPEERLMRPERFAGQHDPHVWFDVSMWMLAVESARDALIERDPKGKDLFEKNAATYLAELTELHAWCGTELAKVPAERRVLVTAHDAFGYFGRAYSVEVLAIQGVSTESESGVADVNALVGTIVTRKIPAVFVESSVPPKLVEALVEGCRSRGHQVKIGGELYSDAMGKEGTPDGTYPGMVRHNVRTIVDALGAGEAK